MNLNNFLRIAVAAVTAVLLAGAPAQAQDKTVRIGFQKYGKLVLLKAKGTLEAKLAPLGYKVDWKEFPSGPALLEALNVGALDFGNVGETPPIFAQAAGAPLAYVAYEPPAPEGEAILVPKNRPQERRRPQGQEGRAQQGLERSLSAGSRAREGRPEIFRHRARVPRAGRCPRRLRARFGRCLGDLGPVPGRGGSRDRGAHARRRHGRRRQPPVLHLVEEVLRRRQEGARCRPRRTARGRWLGARRHQGGRRSS